MGWTGCFLRGISLERLPRSIRRNIPWTPPHSRWPRSASIGKEVFHVVGFGTDGKIARASTSRHALVRSVTA